MSKFYGTLKGNRGEATRCGTVSSGIKVSAQSWEGSLIVHMGYCGSEAEPVVTLSIGEGSSSFGGREVFRGTLSELAAKLA